MALFRAGDEEAFRVIHDRYRRRLFAYTRQMLPRRRQDAEDALQDIFVRAYCGLRANDRELALRAWMYRIAHNRCVDELRRPIPPTSDVLDLIPSRAKDPHEQTEQREAVSRLVADVRRLPEQQRSALLMRELGGIAYADIAGALSVSIPAVKSLLVRARLNLAQALEARDTACSEIREALVLAHDHGERPSSLTRRHMHDCVGCREFRHEVRGASRQFSALLPALGPLGTLAKLFGLGGGAAGGGAAAGGAAGSGATVGGATVGGAAGTGGAIASIGAFAAGASHLVTILAATVITAGGALEIAPPAVIHPHASGAPATSLRATAPSPGAASQTPAGASETPDGDVAPAPVPSAPSGQPDAHQPTSKTASVLSLAGAPTPSSPAPVGTGTAAPGTSTSPAGDGPAGAGPPADGSATPTVGAAGGSSAAGSGATAVATSGSGSSANSGSATATASASGSATASGSGSATGEAKTLESSASTLLHTVTGGAGSVAPGSSSGSSGSKTTGAASTPAGSSSAPGSGAPPAS